MAIGKLRCSVIDVDDLEVAEAFWSELTGLPVIPSPFRGRYSYLGQPDPWRHQMILHLVKRKKGQEANRAHVDIWVDDVDEAIRQVEAIGGTLKQVPTIYPRPGSYPNEAPVIDWAVMQDPFGNEFCVIRLLTLEQSQAVLRTAEDGTPDDAAYRRAASHALAGQ